MTPQIKQRIEQLRHGKVPEGYKKLKQELFPMSGKSVPLAIVLKK